MTNVLLDQKAKLFEVDNLYQTKSTIFLSPDGTFALLSQPDISRICLLSGEETDFIMKSECGSMNCKVEANQLSFSPDGTYILVNNDNSTIIHSICLTTFKVSFFAEIPNFARYSYYGIPIFSPDGKFVLVCCMVTSHIVKICLKSGKVSIFAGIFGKRGFRNGPKEQALFNYPICLTMSPDGTYLLVCERCCIRKICFVSGNVSNFAGIPGTRGKINGTKEQARFCHPRSCAFSPDGTYILVCDSGNNCIRKICLVSGIVTTFAGMLGVSGYRNGPKEQALFIYPKSLTFSKNGKFIIIGDQTHAKNRYIKIEN